MPYEPLHHKYRPQTFGDLVGQETIALTLSNALKQEKIAPAYLFTGPRGTGKTSSARILAKSLNCLASSRPTPNPCGQCEACLAIARGSALDVMEIDAASNTGVDNIREIIERSRFAPVQCRYKIYVIDECHMLSTAAFNALLKTLEEPPPQVVFILATTDPQRVLSTIISRCQRFDYRRIPLEEMTAHLKYIADAEQIAIAEEAITLIAQLANGGLRDAESLLDQLSLLPETITAAKVWDLVGAVSEQDLLKLLQAIHSNDFLKVLQQCRNLLDRGREPLVVLQNLASFYLNLLIAKTAPQRPDLVAVTETCWQQLCTEAANWDTSLILRGQQHLQESETQLKHTTQPRLWLEVTLLGLLPKNSPNTEQSLRIIDTPTANPNSNNSASVDSQVSKQTSQSNIPSPIAPETKQPVREQKPAPVNQTIEPTHTSNTHKILTQISPAPELVEPVPSSNLQSAATNQEIWHQVVSCLQPPTTQALLKQQCHLVSFDGSSAIVGISSAKLQKLNQGKIPNIEAAFAQVCQRKIKVQLEVAAAGSTLPTNPAASRDNFTSEPKKNSPDKQNTSSVALETPKPEANALKPSLSTQSKTVEILPNSHLKTSLANIEPAQNPVPLSPPKVEVVTPPAIIEDSVRTEADDDFQKAIDNLTQSFEGELVQLDNVQSFDDSESPEPENLVSSRPDAEDYEDEW
ncbi:DNA polymerase III subunit gamma/tau [Pleurocapsales cyanobacterium LEGE 10410]|nr:DNA polymerase III subunit gamma/tau [Pleurocapsales cyanobacterium LEGE 10410]